MISLKYLYYNLAVTKSIFRFFFFLTHSFEYCDSKLSILTPSHFFNFLIIVLIILHFKMMNQYLFLKRIPISHG